MKLRSASAFNLILVAAMVAFVMNSYPMMQPGFDMWWHMAMTEAPQLADPNAFPLSRILWHHFWYHLLAFFEVQDFFARALFIHRAQYLLTVLLLTLSSYLSLRAVLHKSNTSRQLILTASIFSCVIWLLMSGTASSPREGGPDSLVVQSWIQWYSLNYQISLPLYFAATATLLYAISVPANIRQRMGWSAISAVLIGLGTLAHAAETANFLICLCFLGCFFLQGRSARILALGLSLLAGAIVWVALEQSYVKPELVVRLTALDFPSLLQSIADLGQAMVDGDLSRNGTGWNALHSAGLASFAVVLVSGLVVRRTARTDSQIDLRSLGFLIATASLPLALLYEYSAGLLAMVTHMYIAWRFTFASFLFVGLPLLGICIAQAFAHLSIIRKQLVLSTVVGLSVSSALLYSYCFENAQPSYQFGKSLIAGLNTQKSHFGWQPNQLSHLRLLADSLRSNREVQPVCVDISTAYYLFFVEHYRAVALPVDLSYLPGFVPSDRACDFAAQAKALPSN